MKCYGKHSVYNEKSDLEHLQGDALNEVIFLQWTRGGHVGKSAQKVDGLGRRQILKSICKLPATLYVCRKDTTIMLRIHNWQHHL